MSFENLGRRQVLGAGAKAAALTAVSYSRVMGANDRVTMGLIGAGDRGRYVMGQFLETGRIEVGAVCDVYANQIDLGWRGTFNIRGFGQAAEVYLGKDLSQINLPEAAQLAGMIQRPAVFDPYRHPDRARDRRNIGRDLVEGAPEGKTRHP